MTWGNRGPGSPAKRRHWAFRPNNENLEERKLLAQVDLTTIQTAPLGVETIGATSNSYAGYTVTDVGNINGTGYDSFIVSAPGVVPPTDGSTPSFGNSSSAAYLVFGSRQVNISNAVDFLNLANGVPNATTGVLQSGQRGSDLGQLGTLGTGNLGQLNPTVQQPTATGSTPTFGFNFDGLTYITGSNRNSALGFSASALGDINQDGLDDFAISAPNASGGGRVFVIYGNTNLTAQSTTNKTVDLQPATGTTNSSTKVVSFSYSNGTAATQVGYSVAGIGNYFNTTSGRDLAIGVPGLNNNTGAVYAITGAFLNNQPTGSNVDLRTTFGQNNGIGGIVYTGINTGDRVGSAVSTAGSFDNAVNGSGAPITSLLIGAPGAATAYLVYGVQSFTGNSTLGTTQSLNTLGATATTNPVFNPLEGVVLIGSNVTTLFGYSVATAGDFNGDGVDDIIVGAPGYSNLTGAAVIFYGVSGTTTSTPTRINGSFIVTIGSGTTGVNSLSLLGTNNGDLTGLSVAPSTHIVFSPDPNSGTSTAVDVLIGAPGFAAGTGTAYLVPGNTSDLGTSQDLTNISSAPLNGTQFLANGSSDPTNNVQLFGYSVSARNPVVNPNNLLTTLDGDNVPDLFIGAPLTDLRDPQNLGSTLRTNSGIVYAVEGALLGGTNGGGGGGGGGGGSGGVSSIFVIPAASLLAPPIFTGETAGLPYPPVSALEKLQSYAPLPVQIAYEQFLPKPGFRARQEIFLHPKKGQTSVQAPRGTYLYVAAIGKSSQSKFTRVNTLPTKVFTRGNQFKHGETKTFKHKVKVIPRSAQTQRFTSA
ncbi:beta strand repeat-containing protein [Tundrisphaera lichenicola]|uniref:beta strand repeat-containing protein n=1 Tax=Tundrisphaera lichenicola TaxID=2029860 RepID=UPI003EC11065